MHDHSHGNITDILTHSFMVISFVFAMMLLIEFLNYYTSGKWKSFIYKNKYSQYLLCSLLGLTPGCLGGFFVVTLFSHGVVSIGALTAAMIATSGDESFIMLKLIPKEYLIISIILFITAIIFGFLIDLILKSKKVNSCPIPKNYDCKLVFSNSFDKVKLYFLSSYLVLIFLLSFLVIHHFKTTSIIVLGSNLICFILLIFTHSHFIKEHILKHVIKILMINISLWTIVAFFAVSFLLENLHVKDIVNDNQGIILFISSIIGFIPESGPHIIFTQLFAKSLIPISILVANSISQDGHAAIPLFAESKKTFLLVKLTNVIAGLAIGGILMIFGF